MIFDYDISLATPNDVLGILALQEPNLPDSGGSLSVRLTADRFKDAILENSVVAGRRDGKVVGYVLGTSLAAKAHVGIIQTMLRTFPPPPDVRFGSGTDIEARPRHVRFTPNSGHSLGHVDRSGDGHRACAAPS